MAKMTIGDFKTLKGKTVKFAFVNSGEDVRIRMGGRDVTFYRKRSGGSFKTIKVKVVTYGGSDVIGLKEVSSESSADFSAIF